MLSNASSVCLNLRAHDRKLMAFVALIAIACAMAGMCQAESVIRWRNRTGQDVITELGNGNEFTTDFKGTNDVKVTKLSGTASAIFFEAFGGSTPGNNPLWVTNFIGNRRSKRATAPPDTGGCSSRRRPLAHFSSISPTHWDRATA
jgi:hypothetical protein